MSDKVTLIFGRKPSPVFRTHITKQKRLYSLGYDIGSSSVKAALVDIATGQAIEVLSIPEKEMTIDAPKEGWAEQEPDMWWKYVIEATHKLLAKSAIDADLIKTIGISYQMHGLVIVDEAGIPLRPSIIWCDSRATDSGKKILDRLGEKYCHQNLLNAPGNFTAAKLLWVKDNEPEIYRRIHKIMLPGDYIAYKLTGKFMTTAGNLSEGAFWDFENKKLSKELLEFLAIDETLFPDIVETFSHQGTILNEITTDLGLSKNTMVSYRAGDQPNNAMSLGVLEPGNIAGTGGTSGVLYGVSDQHITDPLQMVNTFAHVNYRIDDIRTGVLLCINGAGKLYSWIRKMLTDDKISFSEMEGQALKINIGCDGLKIIPFGNGAERMLSNQNVKAHLVDIELNFHTKAHFYRAALEGIAFAYHYGFQAMKRLGMDVSKVRVGNDNLFQSKVFCETVATLLDIDLEIADTTGAVGAGLGAAYGAGLYNSLDKAFSKVEILKTVKPTINKEKYINAYNAWSHKLTELTKNTNQ